jgi:hypothetical protein
MNCLSIVKIYRTGTDKKLPQIGRMRDLLSRGIGVHHGGLLPIVKEVGGSAVFATQTHS